VKPVLFDSVTDAGSRPAAPGTVSGVVVGDLTTVARSLVTGVERVVRGLRPAVELTVIALLSGGHVLVEDVPGTGKTTLAKAVARTAGGTFGRVQATADLLPADITGSSVWDPGSGTFSFVPGPAFVNVLLVDELNRTPPRTQSAFMELMEEHAVTVDGVRHPVPDPFFVVATQNPLDQHGTYPLPEGQLDRFAIRLHLGALDETDELHVVREQLTGPTVEALDAVLAVEQLRAARVAVRQVHVADAVLQYGVALVRGTRQNPLIRLGASSRAALALVRCAQARAVLLGRDYVTPDDVATLAAPVLGHRIVPASSGQHHSADPDRPEQLVRDVVARTPAPLRS
jgi:MoxR-like ATPase